MKSTTLASLIIAGGVAANILVIDNTVLDSWITNHIYCPARYIVEGFDMHDIINVDVAVYIDKDLNQEQKENSKHAGLSARAEYLHKFGINFGMREAEEISIPEKAYTQRFEALSGNDDMTIVFTGKKCFPSEGGGIGYSDPTMNVVFVYAEGYSAAAMRNILIHEIGHLFYASHSNDESCFMNETSSPNKKNMQWCDETLTSIRMYKHKFW
ncbi:MAG: M12 family metallo-peptidase [Nanoarchaeota archaeon]